MLCQNCKQNPAVISYVENINGSKTEYHLCAACYAELKAEFNSKIQDDFLVGGFRMPKTGKACPVCGTTFADYEKTGLLGCAGCYDVFKEELLPSIKRMQGRVEHVGKVGSNADALGLYRQLAVLQEELETALSEKRFGDANKLNGKINEIKKTMHGGGNG